MRDYDDPFGRRRYDPYDMQRQPKGIGHTANGGGATISNSPINVHLTINIDARGGSGALDENGRSEQIRRLVEVLENIFSGRSLRIAQGGRGNDGLRVRDKGPERAKLSVKLESDDA